MRAWRQQRAGAGDVRSRGDMQAKAVGCRGRGSVVQRGRAMQAAAAARSEIALTILGLSARCCTVDRLDTHSCAAGCQGMLLLWLDDDEFSQNFK